MKTPEGMVPYYRDRRLINMVSIEKAERMLEHDSVIAVRSRGIIRRLIHVARPPLIASVHPEKIDSNKKPVQGGLCNGR